MKTIFLASLTLAAFVLSGTSYAITHTLSGPMDVFQATTNPSNVGNGTGSILGDFDDVSKVLNYTLTWQDLTTPVNNIHFHVGAPGVPGGVDLGVPSPWASPQVGSAILSPSQESNLLSGNWYLNVHTTMFSGGEIRGQVLVAAVPEPATASLATIALLSVISLSRRRR